MNNQEASFIQAEFGAGYRLLRKDGYGHVLRAQSISDDLFKICFVKNGGPYAKLGIVVSKKKLSQAVKRNRIKRMVRESFRHHVIKGNMLDIVVMLKTTHVHENKLVKEVLDVLFFRVLEKCVD